MTNPVSSSQSSEFPPINYPFVDPQTGIISLAWYRSYFGLWSRTGGSNGVVSSDIQATADAALTEANNAAAAASSASNTAASALTTANTALSTADAVASSAMFKTNNLSDVASVLLARVNLGVDTIPLSFTYDTLTAGLIRYVPIVRNLNLPGNFTGCVTYCGTLPTYQTTFTVGLIRSGAATTIGTVKLNTNNTATLSSQALVNLYVNDVLTLTAQSPADPTLAHVGITFLMVLA